MQRALCVLPGGRESKRTSCKHLLASQLLHIGFDERVDKLVGDGNLLCWNQQWERARILRLKHWMQIHTWLTAFNSVVKQKSAFVLFDTGEQGSKPSSD